jgi:hypothetical protein
MKTVVIAGVTFFVGLIVGSVALFTWHNNHPIVCICKPPMGGDPGGWVGEQCSDEWRQRFNQQFPGCVVP